MSRKNARQLERVKPDMAYAVSCAKGEGDALMAIGDAMEEEGVTAGGDLMVQRFIVGQAYWMETTLWVYLGRIIAVGKDYIELGEACRMPSDGRHNIMMSTGTAPNIEIETTGGKYRKMRIPIDSIGPNCEWHFPIPQQSI